MNSLGSVFSYAPFLAATFAAAASLWIGTLFSVSWLSGCARMMADGPEIGRLATSLFRRWTTASLWVALLTGLGWMALERFSRTSPRGMIAAALGVPLLLMLHGAVGRRAKRVARGSVDALRGEAFQRFAILVSLCAGLALAILR